MPANSPASPIKTWTSHEPTSPAKWLFVFWLSVILTVLTALFLWWVRPPNTPVTFFVSLAIEDYRDLLPKPHYPVWSSEEIERLQDSRELVKWRFMEDNGLISGADSLGSVIGALPETLKKNEINSQATLVLQLRMHAEAHTDSTGQLELDLLTGEKATESSSQIGRYAFKELLKTLHKVPAQDVIVLADICDLDYAPQIGLHVNPIASALTSLCARESARSGQNIWILCAARDGDSNYISHLRGKTLLQSACEFALDRGSNQTADDSDIFISLAEFYQQVWRYCRRATKTTNGGNSMSDLSQQLPVLMRVGDNEPVQTGESNLRSWDAAQRVFVARLKKTKSKPTKDKDDPEKSEGNADNAKPGADPSNADEQPFDSVLQYWQLRDELQSAKTKWSPSMFAPHHWQAQQLDVARRQFDIFSTDNENASKIENALDELKMLIKEMSNSINTVDNQPSLRLVSAFRQFRQDETFKIIRKPWEQNSQLLANESQQWVVASNSYRKYANACAEIPAWAQWYRHDLSDVGNFNSFAETLVGLRKILPKDGSAILDQKEAFDTKRIDVCLAQLNSNFDKLHRILKVRFQKTKLDWQHEHILQELLQSPLLDFNLRKDLWQEWKKLKEDKPLSHIIEPDKSSEMFNRRERVTSETGSLNKSLPAWTDAVSQLGQLANVTGMTIKTDWSSKSGSTWHLFGEKIYQAKPAYSGAQDLRLHDWHVRCLSGMLMDQADIGFAAGIVLPASVSRALQVRAGTNNDLPIKFGNNSVIELPLEVQRADSSEVDQIWLSWKLRNPTVTASDSLLRISHDEQPLGETRQQVKVNKRTLRLQLNSIVDSRSIKAPLEIELFTAEHEGDTPSSTTLRVIPKQPDKIDLAVHRFVGSERLKIERQEWYHDLNTLAVQGALSRFRFSLMNLSSQPKRCQVSLYALPMNAIGASPPPTVSIQAFRERFSPIAQSLPIALPEAEVGRDQPVTVELKPAVPGPGSADAKNVAQQYGWLYFHIQEVDAENKTKSESAEFCRLRGISPTDAKLVVVKPETQSNFRLFFEPNPKVWAEHGLTELLINTDAYDAEGTSLKPQPTPKKLSLTSGKIPVVVVENNDPNNVVNAYLSIGTYPRAIAYESTQGKASAPNVISLDVSSIKGLTSTPENGAFKPIDPKPGSAIELNARNRVFVMPAKDAEGGRITYNGLSFKASIDAPYSIELLDDSGQNQLGSTEPSSDIRQMSYSWKILDGDFALSATASDLNLTILPGLELKGRLKLNIRDVHGNIPPAATAVLIFDSESPEPISIRRDTEGEALGNGQTIKLVRGASLTLRIQARDVGAGSGVELVQLYIDSRATPPKPLTTTYREKLRIWECFVEPENYESERGEFTIVAMSKDYAGNVQLTHPKITVRLEAPPKPPKVDDKAK